MLKLAINISLAVQMLAFAEGLLLAERSGVDRQRALEVMESSPIGSPMLRARASIILDPPEEAWFDLSFMHKDIELALDAARRLEIPLPTAERADEVLERARRSATSGATSPRCSRRSRRLRTPSLAARDSLEAGSRDDGRRALSTLTEMNEGEANGR